MNFKGTPPTSAEVERIRLLLSTYQDGTGQYKLKGISHTLPGWRDFERAVAVAMNGEAQESKTLYDVIVSSETGNFGISCKMRAELGSVIRSGTILIEVSNAAKDFWRALGSTGVHSGKDMQENPHISGKAIVDLVHSWHIRPDIDAQKSYYLVCQYRKKPLEYQLFQLTLEMPNPEKLEWDVRIGRNDEGGQTNCLIGSNAESKVIEWYADSGGQLKYYPTIADAVWQSDVFTLEPLPDTDDGYSILNKAKAYFPELWQAVGT